MLYYFSFYIMFPFFISGGVGFLILSLMFYLKSFSFLVYWTFMSSSFCLNFPFYFDYMSCMFMSVVFFISGSVIYYTEDYCHSEPYKSRFFWLVFLFIMSMMFLILSPNFFCMLLGWDGLGLVSYCLVIFYQNPSSFNSGMVTALTNRVGDVFILSSICLFFLNGEFSYMNFLDMKESFYLILFFFIASLTKSAQIPFSAWLPAAMAAPTPVSALVHSSTLVTAGIYILIRFSYFLTSSMKLILMLISLLTMIMSGFSGILEFNLKKIIALSTLSQLGFMMATISLGYPKLAFFHLITHAGFKALLFMCSGLFIHLFLDVQDIRLYGLLTKNFSFPLCMFNVASLSLTGFPFLSGFFSKDLILELVLVSNLSFVYFILFLIGTFLTVFYSFRLFIYLSLKTPYHKSLEKNIKNFGVNHKCLLILYFFSITMGFLVSNLFFFPFNYLVMPLGMKVLISVICLVSFFLSLSYSFFYSVFKNLFILFLGQMWFLMYLKTDFYKLIMLNFCYLISKSLVGWVEWMGGQKSLSYLYKLSGNLNFVLANKISSLFFMFSMYLFFFILLGV